MRVMRPHGSDRRLDTGVHLLVPWVRFAGGQTAKQTAFHNGASFQAELLLGLGRNKTRPRKPGEEKWSPPGSRLLPAPSRRSAATHPGQTGHM